VSDFAITVSSYQDYKKYLEQLMMNVSPLKGLKFCVWCIKRHQTKYGEIIWDGLNQTERSQLEFVINELEVVAQDGLILVLEKASNFLLILEKFGPEDEYAEDAVEIAPEALAFYNLAYQALTWCTASNSSSLCGVSEEMINALDFEQEDPSYQLENMFTFPDLRHELELQRDFVESSNWHLDRSN
jgi:hypothetical protein